MSVDVEGPGGPTQYGGAAGAAAMAAASAATVTASASASASAVPAGSSGVVLTDEEIDKFRAAFAHFDHGKSGAVDVFDLRALIQEVGFSPTEEELLDIINEHDPKGTGFVDFAGFCQAMAKLLSALRKDDVDVDTIDAFVAMGGNRDKTGQIRAEKLIATIKEFELTIDIEKLIREADTDGSGFIDFDEFSAMLANDDD